MMRFLSLVLILVFALPAPVAFADEKCEKNLESGAAQDANAKAVQKLFELRERFDERLFPDVDPYANALTLDESQKWTEYFSFEGQGASVKRSILGETRHFLNTTAIRKPEQILPMIEKILAAGERILSQPSADKAALYRGSLAVELIIPSVISAMPQALSQIKPQAPNKPKSDDKKEEQNSPLDQEAPPEYPDDQEDNYNPHTKDSEGGRQKANQTFIAVEFSQPGVLFFKNQTYNDVVRSGEKRFRITPLPGQRTKRLKPFARTKNVLTLNLNGKSDVLVLVPVGFEPVMPEPGVPVTISPTDGGQYLIRNPQQLKTVTLYLTPEDQDYNALQLEFLKKPLGIDPKEWPHEMASELFPLVEKADALTAIRKVEGYIKYKYLYSVGPRPELDPVAALKAGAFQCDMAAMIMVALVRDVLKLPARVVSGFNGFPSKENPNVSVVRLPNDRHAAVEVFVNGKWQYFDPTPSRKDKKNKEEEGGDQPGANQKDYDDEFKTEDDEKSAPEGESQPAEGKSSKEKKDDKDKPDSKAGAPSDEEDEQGKGGASKKLDEKEAAELAAELAKALKWGSLSLKPERVDGRIVGRARQVLLREALNPIYDTSTGLQKLKRVEIDLKDEVEYKRLVREANVALTFRQRAVAEAMFHLAATVKKSNPVESFKKLVQMEDRLVQYHRVLDAQDKKRLDPLLAELRRLKEEFQRLNTAERLQIGRAEKFYDGLPNHTRQLVKQRYKFPVIGENTQTRALAEDLKAGGTGSIRDKDLLSYNLIRLLYPMTDFIMDSMPTPAYRWIRTFMEDRRYTRGNDFIPLEDLARARRAVITQPHKSLTQNVREGTAFLPARKQRLKVPSPTGVTQPMRVTIVGFDTSGSMGGNPGDFQTGLIQAFVDRALSDIVNGRHNHIAHLLGFDDGVHFSKAVKNSADAYDILMKGRSYLKNQGRGTNIMAVLEEAFAQILDAQKRNNGEPLAAANVILMSDGGSTIDLKRLQKLMSLVNEKTPIKFMFVAINGENEDLRKLTLDVRSLGASESYYHMFKGGDIDEFIANAQRSPEPNLERELYTDKRADALPHNMENRLTMLAGRLDEAIKTINLDQRPQDLKYWITQIKKIPFAEQKPKYTPIGSELSRFRSLADNSKGAFKERREIQLVADDLMRNFSEITGMPFTKLMLNDADSLRHLIEAAEYYASGGGRD